MRRLIIYLGAACLISGIVSFVPALFLAVWAAVRTYSPAFAGSGEYREGLGGVPPWVETWCVASLAVAGAGFIALVLAQGSPHRYDYKRGRVCRCGYDVRGLARCPECGRPQ